MVIAITAECPVPEVVKIIEIVVSNDTDSGQSIHTQYRYVNGTYISPLQSNLVTMVSGTTNPLISRYNITTGYAGTGSIPPELSTMTIQTNKTFSDDFVFNPLNDKFRYLRSNIVYPNTPTGVLDAIQLSTIASPITLSGSTYSANFTVPSKALGDVLYLIWDFRDSIPLDLCYSNNEKDPQKTVCCNCEQCTSTCITVIVANNSSVNDATINFGRVSGGLCFSKEGEFTVKLDPDEVIEICIVTSTDYIIEEGDASVTPKECANCSTYVYVNPSSSESEATVSYKDCLTGEDTTINIPISASKKFCCQFGELPNVIVGQEENLYMTNLCKCCEDNNCTQWQIYGIASAAFIAWTDCNNIETNGTFTSDSYICVREGFIPNIISGECYIKPFNGCANHCSNNNYNNICLYHKHTT